jgi:hypothetical protein
VELAMDGLARDGALRELKGPALAVLVAVGRHGRATHAQLSAETGWGRNTTYEALRRLVGAGWLAADGRGWWLLTAEREDVWDGLWGGGRGPVGDASAAAPGDGPAGETAVPANGTVIHRPRKSVPEGGTVIHRQAEKVTGNGTKAVPRNGTKRGKGVPGKGTKRRKRVPGSGTAQEVVPGNGTAPHHDDHVDHDAVDDHQSAINNIIQRLEALDDPFDRAGEWAPQQDQHLLVRWVEFLEQAPEAWHNRFTSSTAFMRTRVEAGLPPPPLDRKRKKRRACTRCGHSVWDADGSCLVCAGVVRI